MLRPVFPGTIISTNVFLSITRTQVPHIRAKSTLISLHTLIFKVSFGNRFGDLISTFYFNLP